VLNDGSIMMSQETMAEVFGNWWSDRPAFISIHLAPGADVNAVRQQLNRTLVGRGEAIDKREFEAARARLLVARDAGRLHHRSRASSWA
jgi:hypothetical protein